MNTPAHILLALAAFSKRDKPKRTGMAALGGLAPDLSLYILAGSALFLFGLSPQRVFNELYFSDSWQTIFAIDNSFVLWGLGLGLALWRRWPLVVVLCAAALFHIALDFGLHNDDGRAHFWPLSDWIFASPLSYWDSDHGAGWVAPLSVVICFLAACLLIWRHRAWAMRAAVIALFGLEVWTARQWILFF